MRRNSIICVLEFFPRLNPRSALGTTLPSLASLPSCRLRERSTGTSLV